MEGYERRGILGGEEEYVLCLIYHGCCRRQCRLQCKGERTVCWWKVVLYLFILEITKSMTHIARIQSKDTHYKLRLLFQISISTAYI